MGLSRAQYKSGEGHITATQPVVAADRLQLRSFLAPLPATAELGRWTDPHTAGDVGRESAMMERC